ncbi:sensor histidine kinase [Chitinophaga varians]|uniref:sensor histidine kinase n=1 Tax=Chitinophaga varians TaxID=2202339 RepID=UPI00165FDFC9|nr:7TM diverse intracellular signaling domain-containing protein [Chitinophaga varians]MBC9911828.1 hypothetical protein [Chitinophaga varians]
MKLFTFFLLLLSGCCCRGWAQDLVLTSPEKVCSLRYPLLWRDTSAIQDFAAAVKAPFKKSGQAVVALGTTADAAWLTFDIENNTSRHEWGLEIPVPVLRQVDFYMQDSTGFRHLEASGDQHYQERQVRVNNILFPFTLAPGRKAKVYLRATSQHTLRIPVYVGTMQALYEKNHTKDFINGLAYGVMAALMLTNFFVFLIMGDKTYLYYACYLFFSALLQISWNGYLLDFFPQTGFNLASLILTIAVLFSILFTNAFLQTRIYLPRIYRTQNWLIAFFSLPLVLIVIGWYDWSFRIFQWQMYLVFAWWLYAGVSSLRKGFKPARYYLAAFLCLIIGGLIFNFRDNGWIPETSFPWLTIHVGPLLEVLIQSFALALKLNEYKQDKEKAQAMALVQANDFSRDLIHVQESERKRVATELHDSVGQQLILLKNRTLLLQRNGPDPQQVEGLATGIRDVLQEIRDISYSLRPYQIDMLGFGQSVRSLMGDMMDAAGIDYQIAIDPIDQLLGKDNEMNLYRILQEVLNNIIKHARATMATLEIKKGVSLISIRVVDNGQGFTPELQSKGLGMTSIRERAILLQGRLLITPAETGGTEVTITIPFKL